MPRTIQFSELEPVERRVALMHVANASLGVIAQALEMNTTTVDEILKRPRVARFCMLLHGVVSEGLETGIADLNAAFKSHAHEAFRAELKVMRDLDDIGDAEDVKVSTRVRAKLGVTFSARDIMDRAGYKAPTKVYNYGSKELDPEAAEALTQAARELAEIYREREQAIDVTPTALQISNGSDPNT